MIELKIIAAVTLGMTLGMMFTHIVDAIENHYRMKLMLNSALEHAQNEENNKKKTQKK